MSITLKTTTAQLEALLEAASVTTSDSITVNRTVLLQLLQSATAAHMLQALINSPHTAEFLEATRLEAAHQVDRWGEAHDRGKSAENWFWLVGYLAGKCLRACIEGDKDKALHHTISSAAALLNWHKAIAADTTGTGIGHDNDIKPIELARFEGGDSIETSEREAITLPVVRLGEDQYSGR